MDQFSVTAGVIGITAACLQAVRALNGLRSKYNEASTTITAICAESTLVSASLSHIQALLLRTPDALTDQLQSRPELAATFDTTLTGCKVVFACLDEEIKRLDLLAYKVDGREGWRRKAKARWKTDTMKELLQSIRGQQSAITLLIQLLQMESLSDIHRLIQNNTAVLDEVAQRTRSLRTSNPHISVPESIFGMRKEVLSISRDNASTIGRVEFEFDDVVVDSRAYRRAVASAMRREKEELFQKAPKTDGDSRGGFESIYVPTRPASAERLECPNDHRLSSSDNKNMNNAHLTAKL